jgi:hypothetical protein
MQSPQHSPTFDYPSRAYPYPHVNLSEVNAKPTCLPPAPPPTATIPSTTVGEYFFPFQVDSPHPQGASGYMTSPQNRRTHSDSTKTTGEHGPRPAYPQMPRRSSFNYVHDLAEFTRQHQAPKEFTDEDAEAEEDPQENTTPPTTPGRRRPRRLSLRDYLPLGRLPLNIPSDSENKKKNDTSTPPPTPKAQYSTLTPPASPDLRKQYHSAHRIPLSHFHRRSQTVTHPKLICHPGQASGTAPHNCYNREDLKHLQHVQFLVEEAVDAFVIGGEERRRGRHSFGLEGFGYTSTPM